MLPRFGFGQCSSPKFTTDGSRAMDGLMMHGEGDGPDYMTFETGRNFGCVHHEPTAADTAANMLRAAGAPVSDAAVRAARKLLQGE